MARTLRSSCLGLAAAAGCGLLVGCQSLPGGLLGSEKRQSATHSPDESIASDVYRRAEIERSEWYEREVKRLRADLAQAEESIVAMESGLRGSQSRAHAVSALAEARIALDRVERKVPWRATAVAEARSKLDDATRQMERGHIGSALFFSSRSRRITANLEAEAQQVAGWSDRVWVRGERVNLRAGPAANRQIVDVLVGETPVFPERIQGSWRLVRTPAGQVGWVHNSLLRAP
jgi:hypothetical protein